MRGRNSLAVAVRRPNGEISVKEEPLSTLFTGRIRQTPFVRGPIVLIETFVLGVKALMYSASVSLEDEEEEIGTGMLWGIIAIGILLAVGLFLVLPLMITRYVVDPHTSSDIVSNLTDGVIRFIVFFAYLKAMTLMPDIRRVFAYHGKIWNCSYPLWNELHCHCLYNCAHSPRLFRSS